MHKLGDPHTTLSLKHCSYDVFMFVGVVLLGVTGWSDPACRSVGGVQASHLMIFKVPAQSDVYFGIANRPKLCASINLQMAEFLSFDAPGASSNIRWYSTALSSFNIVMKTADKCTVTSSSSWCSPIIFSLRCVGAREMNSCSYGGEGRVPSVSFKLRMWHRITIYSAVNCNWPMCTWSTSCSDDLSSLTCRNYVQVASIYWFWPSSWARSKHELRDSAAYWFK